MGVGRAGHTANRAPHPPTQPSRHSGGCAPHCRTPLQAGEYVAHTGGRYVRFEDGGPAGRGCRLGRPDRRRRAPFVCARPQLHGSPQRLPTGVPVGVVGEVCFRRPIACLDVCAVGCRGRPSALPTPRTQPNSIGDNQAQMSASGPVNRRGGGGSGNPTAHTVRPSVGSSLGAGSLPFRSKCAPAAAAVAGKARRAVSVSPAAM